MTETQLFQDLGLNRLVVRNLARMSYEQPRPIQAAAIPPLLAGRDVIGLAQTGTGKTAAFAAPMLHHLLEARPSAAAIDEAGPLARLRGLVLCPTRELAQQVADEAASIARGTAVRVACAYGKVSIRPQARAIAQGVDLLVATPGRVRELLETDALSLAWIRFATIDEADRMLDMGFLPQVEFILARIPPKPQLALFTATMPDDVARLAAGFLVDAVRVEIGRHTTPVAHVRQRLVLVDQAAKAPLTLHLLKDGARTGVLVFCRTRRRVGWVGAALARHGLRVGMIHGDRSQTQRQRSLDRFARGELDVLVATDVASRGLHIPAVQTVINYDLPAAAEDYVHRVGRAAHGAPGAGGEAGAETGEAFTLLEPRERDDWRVIERATDIELMPEPIAGFEPPVTARRKRQATAPESGASRPGGRVRPDPPRPSKKSRPIPKNQKPGRGVIKLPRPNDSDHR